MSDGYDERLEHRFEQVDNEYGEFEKIDSPPSQHPDVCAFLLLEKLVPADPAGCKIVSSSGHDEIFLLTSPESLEAVATDADILYLARCGVRYDEGNDSLAMFV